MPEITDEMTQRLYESVATDLLPNLPGTKGCDDGYDWIELLVGTGWEPIDGDPSGRLYGDWPYQVVAFHTDDERSLYGLAVYTEGDVTVEGFRDRQARDRAAGAHLEDEEDAS